MDGGRVKKFKLLPNFKKKNLNLIYELYILKFWVCVTSTWWL